MLIDTGYSDVSVWESIRVQKHLVNNFHLKEQGITWMQAVGPGGLSRPQAELSGVWAHNLLLKQRDIKQQKLQASQTVSEDSLQRGFGRSQRFCSLTAQAGVPSGIFAHLSEWDLLRFPVGGDESRAR